jgi:hypothetical protein
MRSVDVETNQQIDFSDGDEEEEEEEEESGDKSGGKELGKRKIKPTQ